MIGLGYVGLPVAVAFARSGVPVVGFDIDSRRVAELRAGIDRTREVEPSDLSHRSLVYENDPTSLSRSDFFIVTVPTPVDAACRPDLGAMLKASETVGRALKRGDIVVYEFDGLSRRGRRRLRSGAGEGSGLKRGSDFTVGYSPERINPGDKAHRFETIVKVVSGQDARTLDIVADVYGSVVKAGIHRAPSIKVAEAAKVIENTQRDLNIAFMNELSAIFQTLGIDTADVLAAAADQMELPEFPAGPGRRPLHRRRSVLPDLSRRKGRLSSGDHPRRAAASTTAWASASRDECIRALLQRKCTGGDGHRARHDVQGERAGHPQFQGRRHHPRAWQARGVAVQVHDPLALGGRCHARIRHRALFVRGAAAGRCRHLRGRASRLCARRLAADHRASQGGKGSVFDVKSKLDRAGKPDGVELWRL